MTSAVEHHIVVGPDRFEPVLARLRDDSDRYFGVSPVTFQTVGWMERPVSQVLRISIRNGSTTRYAFVKRFKPLGKGDEHRRLMRDRVARDFATLTRVHLALAGRPGLSAVRPIACFPDDLILVTEEAPGSTLSTVLEARGGWRPSGATLDELARIHERIGQWVRAFQGIETLGRRFSLDGMRAYIDLRLDNVVRSEREAFSERDRLAVLCYFDRRRRQITAADLAEVAVHGDLCPANILVRGETVALIDFDRSTTGGMYHDLARMYTQLEFLKAKPKFRTRIVDRLQSALLRGFDPGLTPEHPLFELFLLQHTVCQLKKMAVRRPRPRGWISDWYLRRRHRHWLRSLASAA